MRRAQPCSSANNASTAAMANCKQNDNTAIPMLPPKKHRSSSVGPPAATQQQRQATQRGGATETVFLAKDCGASTATTQVCTVSRVGLYVAKKKHRIFDEKNFV